MLSYSLKCSKNAESKNPEDVKTKIGRTMLLSKCAVHDSKKSKFIKEQKDENIFEMLKNYTLPGAVLSRWL